MQFPAFHASYCRILWFLLLHNLFQKFPKCFTVFVLTWRLQLSTDCVITCLKNLSRCSNLSLVSAVLFGNIVGDGAENRKWIFGALFVSEVTEPILLFGFSGRHVGYWYGITFICGNMVFLVIEAQFADFGKVSFCNPCIQWFIFNELLFIFTVQCSNSICFTRFLAFFLRI